MILFLSCATTSPPPTVSDTVAIEAPLPLPPEPEPEPEPEPLRSPEGVAMLDCPETPREGMSCVPGGPYTRGTDEAHKCDQYENIAQHTTVGPVQEIWVQSFYMDKTEVTYSAYQSCVQKGDCPPAKPSYSDYNRPNQPMVGLSWYAADTYCKAQDQFLPSEAQWEKAARGPDGAQTPFGLDTVSCEHAVVMNEDGRSCGTKKLKGSHPDKGRTWEVGLKPAGAYGLYDMVGNAEEWVSDWFSASWETCGDACSGLDPLGPCGTAAKCSGHPLKMVKGGSWYWPAEHAKSWHRRPHVPSNDPYHHFGFRCAASLKSN